MHIADGLLDAKTAIATAILSAAGLALALRDARRTLPPRKIPLLGLSAAFVFAAQMLNFPVIGGTSGHLVGGVLTAALLGPSAAVIVLSAVLIVQCFMFADGGLTALGANIFNMGIVGAVGGWLIYAPLARLFKGLFGCLLAASVAAWAATLLAAIACAGELAASGTVSWNIAFPAMAGVHMLIGIGEGLITALVLSSIAAARPELVLIAPNTQTPRSYATPALFGLLATLGLALFVAPFASPWPDALDRFIATLGIQPANHAISSPLPDYQFPGFTSPSLGIALAGLIGTLIVFTGAWLLARSLIKSAPAVSTKDQP